MAPKYTPTSENYKDLDLFGPRHEVSRYINRFKSHNDPECVIFGSNTFADKREQWRLKDLIGFDKRLNAMLQCKRAKYGETGCITYEGTGKTYAHLLYTVAQIIKRIPIHETEKMLAAETGYIYESNNDADLDDLRNYPRCLIVTSTHDQAEILVRMLDRLKENAYENQASNQNRLRFMPPVARSVSVDQQEDKLILKCHESEILIGTPPALIKCLELRVVNFAKTDRIVFDDIDLCLQLWNYKIQELISIYACQTESLKNISARSEPRNQSTIRYAQMLMFSRKWTALLKKFMTTLFPQRTLIFGSVAEASIYLNLRFELESYEDQEEKVTKLLKLISYISEHNILNPQHLVKYAIVCCNEDEAYELKLKLTAKTDKIIKLIDNEQLSHKINYSSRQTTEAIVIITDSAIDFEVEFSSSRKPMNDINHLVHYSLPKDMLIFDQRFRLMHKKIREETPGLLSTIFIGPKMTNLQAKQLYDLFSRSSTTLRGTVSELRDRFVCQPHPICWRWATIGLCRFEKLSRDDHFGSYCAERHSLLPSDRSPKNRWPQSGQLKITLTHVVSPNEFYFWFESHRDINNKIWIKLESTGQDFMQKLRPDLDKLKSAGIRSVPIEQIKKGCIYAVYFQQEARVDRVLLLDEPKHAIESSTRNYQRAITTSMARINPEKEYRELIPVIKIDYGSRIDVYVENIIQLPPELAKIEPQCHRGFHIGFKPTSNEPNWHYRTKRLFYEKVNAQNIHSVTVWLRMNRDNCFWLDNMTVSRQLTNIDSNGILSVQPHRELSKDGLAEITKSEPAFLPPSIRLLTLGKWNSQKLAECTQYAFLRKDKPVLDIYLLNAYGEFDLVVRQHEFNKRLIELEDQMIEDYNSGKLIKQQHFSENIYCLARILEGKNKETGENIYTINRALIKAVQLTGIPEMKNLDMPEDDEQSNKHEYKIECFDHGDCFVVGREDLYQAPANYFATLPLQAIRCKLANVNPILLGDDKLRKKAINCMIDFSRTKSNLNKVVKSRFSEDGHLYLYATKDESDDNTYYPMSILLQEKGIQLHDVTYPEFGRIILPQVEENNFAQESDKARMLISEAIISILTDMVRQELLALGADAEFIERKTANVIDSDLALD